MFECKALYVALKRVNQAPMSGQSPHPVNVQQQNCLVVDTPYIFLALVASWGDLLQLSQELPRWPFPQPGRNCRGGAEHNSACWCPEGCAIQMCLHLTKNQCKTPPHSTLQLRGCCTSHGMLDKWSSLRICVLSCLEPGPEVYFLSLSPKTC